MARYYILASSLWGSKLGIGVVPCCLMSVAIQLMVCDALSIDAVAPRYESVLLSTGPGEYRTVHTVRDTE